MEKRIQPLIDAFGDAMVVVVPSTSEAA